MLVRQANYWFGWLESLFFYKDVCRNLYIVCIIHVYILCKLIANNLQIQVFYCWSPLKYKNILSYNMHFLKVNTLKSSRIMLPDLEESCKTWHSFAFAHKQSTRVVVCLPEILKDWYRWNHCLERLQCKSFPNFRHIYNLVKLVNKTNRFFLNTSNKGSNSFYLH